jgi:hypothetical protein
MPVRLGDDIDDFCVKCKRVMNHLVVSIVSEGPAKVRCKTCYSDHDFRNEQAPPPKEKKPPVVRVAVAGVDLPEVDLLVEDLLVADAEVAE